MLAGAYSRFNVLRPEMGRRTEKNQVNSRIDDFLIAVKSYKAFIIRDFDILFFFELRTAVIDLVLEYIAQCSDLQIGTGIKEVGGSSRSSSTASDKSCFKRLPVRRLIKKYR